MNTFFPTEPLSGFIENFDWKTFSFNQSKFKELHFTIRLPNGFDLVVADPDAPSLQKPYIDAAYFKAGKNAEVLVQVSAIEHEVSLFDYYNFFLTEGKEQLLHHRFINQNQDQPDLLSQRTFPDGQTWLTRKTGYKVWNGSGAFVITVNTACNTSKYKEETAHVMLEIMQSLKAIHEIEYDKAEIQYLFTRRYPIDFACYLPVSWHELHHHNNTMEYMNLAFLKKVGENPVGVIYVQAKAITYDQTLENAVSGFLKMYADRFELENKKVDRPLQFKHFTGKVTEGEVLLHPQKEETPVFNYLRYLIFKHGNFWFYIEVNSYRIDENFECHTISKRALQLVCENFRVG